MNIVEYSDMIDRIRGLPIDESARRDVSRKLDGLQRELERFLGRSIQLPAAVQAIVTANDPANPYTEKVATDAVGHGYLKYFAVNDQIQLASSLGGAISPLGYADNVGGSAIVSMPFYGSGFADTLYGLAQTFVGVNVVEDGVFTGFPNSWFTATYVPQALDTRRPEDMQDIIDAMMDVAARSFVDFHSFARAPGLPATTGRTTRIDVRPTGWRDDEFALLDRLRRKMVFS